MIYPDFTIRDPSSGKTYYWEHFGMMDQPSYAARTFSKLQLYTSFQIIPSIQLITTYETQEHPLEHRNGRSPGAAVFPIRARADSEIRPFWLVFTFSHPSHSPYPYHQNIGRKCTFFSTVPRDYWGNPKFHWISTGFFQRIGRILRFSSCMPKNTGILGIAEKKSLLCPTARPEVAPGSPHNAKSPVQRTGRAAPIFFLHRSFSE